MKKQLMTAGLLLGAGLGGFLDGIILHQILQVHSMLSALLPQDVLVNVKTSMIWDGIFHFLTWLFTVAGIVQLYRALSGRLSLTTRAPVHAGRYVSGWCITGWGLFNLIEGTADHVVFQIHHVVENSGLSIYDYAFLVFGALLCVTGSVVTRGASKPAPSHQH